MSVCEAQVAWEANIPQFVCWNLSWSTESAPLGQTMMVFTEGFTCWVSCEKLGVRNNERWSDYPQVGERGCSVSPRNVCVHNILFPLVEQETWWCVTSLAQKGEGSNIKKHRRWYMVVNKDFINSMFVTSDINTRRWGKHKLTNINHDRWNLGSTA